MNLRIVVDVYVPPEDWNPEGVEKLAVKVSDALIDAGYGNVADEDPEQTKLTSVVIAKPAPEGGWKRAAKDAMFVSFPTEDPAFVLQADAGGIIE